MVVPLKCSQLDTCSVPVEGEQWRVGRNTSVTHVSSLNGKEHLHLLSTPGLPSELYVDRCRRVSLCDFIFRKLCAAVSGSPLAVSSGVSFAPTPGQFVLERNCVLMCKNTGNISAFFSLQRRQGFTWEKVEKGLEEIVRKALVPREQNGGLDIVAARKHVYSVEDQRSLRRMLTASEGVAFVADGSVLPRQSGSDNRPMEGSGVVRFESPETLRGEFDLPHAGKIRGMVVPRGVTLIVGGGYHGKSTLLRALAVGVYDKVPGDGREFVVTDPGAMSVRAEDGRPVNGVDVSAFIGGLPTTTLAAGVDATCFSTGEASGSTSQAANVMEALEAGATALLLDEDTCAGNFMIRDSRMRAMVHNEPITPFIYRVSSIWLQLGISSIIVVGGCGDYFDIHDTAILVDSYKVTDATERAHSISRRFCVGRVQYAGRGLVKRLPWDVQPAPRTIVPGSLPCSWAPQTQRPSEVCNGEEKSPTGTEQGGGEDLGHGCSYCHARGKVMTSRTRQVYFGGLSADLSRVEQLVGGPAQARGCSLAVAWIAQAMENEPGLSIAEALDRMEAILNAEEGDGLRVLLGTIVGSGLPGLIVNETGESAQSGEKRGWFGGVTELLGSVSDEVVARPRRFEVAAALHRLPGVIFARAGKPVRSERETAARVERVQAQKTVS